MGTPSVWSENPGKLSWESEGPRQETCPGSYSKRQTPRQNHHDSVQPLWKES